MFPDDETRRAAGKVRQDVHGHETGLSPISEEHLSLLRGLYDGEVATLDHAVGEVVGMLRDLEDLPLPGPHPLPTEDSGPFSDRHVVAEYDRPSVRLEAFRKRWPEHDFSRFDRTLAALRFGEWKLIVGSDGARELYNIADDPGETVDLAEGRADLTEELSARLADWLGSLPSADGPRPDGEELEPMDEETKRNLRSLGYVK